jgi:hypothetical protein
MKIILGLLAMVWLGSIASAPAEVGKNIIHPTIPYVDSTSPAVKRDRRIKITPADLQRECPHPKPYEAFWMVERDGRWMLVDPLVSQQLH